ncbi:MAG: PIF1 family DEAD/DEAH box helicase [bacterium]|nr:PIF1 family DEAD/DEAH box helicase [bacterium]
MTQKQALEILKTGANVFLSGEPGSGKTYTVNQYVSYLRSRKIEAAITASTGIAATHIGGMTIHSWSGIGIKRKLDKYDLDRISSNERVAKRIRHAKVLIIDEVSMLSPQTLSMVDMVCREVKEDSQAFGGLQVLLVGDFFQLPPVVKRDEINLQNVLIEEVTARFAYDAPCWLRTQFLTCYLTEQYRQDDRNFLSILSAIRRNEYNETHHVYIKKRQVTRENAPKGIPRLFSHNEDVEKVNAQELSKIKEKERTFEMISQGTPLLIHTLKKGCLSPEILKLKVGAKVMFTKNNPQAGFVNGTLGEVEDLNSFGSPIIRTRNNRSIVAEPMTWTVEEGGSVRARITQVPLRLAWAITVHKSQGMSLDEAVMDLSDVFEFGQGYVALSRVRRLSGLYLLGWNKQTFEVHPEVLEKDAEFREWSQVTMEAFDNISFHELTRMQGNFIKAVGGRLPEKKKKLKRI